jgi:small GTP-binding protein
MSLYVYKVIIIGSGAVGKTSLLHRFVENHFSFRYKLTIGADFLSKVLEGFPNPDSTVKLQIWDIGGQERYKFLRSSFFEGANGALTVFDISRWHTFTELDDWISDLGQFAGEHVPFVILGNKADLIHDIGREYDKESAEILAQSKNTHFVETSAKTGDNVEGAFLSLTQKMISNTIHR